MTRRGEASLARGLQRAMNGGRTTRQAFDLMRPPHEWELVVAALELALLGKTRDEPPAHLAASLTQLLEPAARKPSR